MTYWQYTLAQNCELNELNRMGEAGWELVFMQVWGNQTSLRDYYFKRPYHRRDE